MLCGSQCGLASAAQSQSICPVIADFSLLRPPSPYLQNLGVDWDERVLPSIGNEVLKAVVAQYNAEQLLTQRDKVGLGLRGCVHVGGVCCSVCLGGSKELHKLGLVG